MLQEIKIKNLAIIEDLNINFSSNFTALTGATGAGKSLVIDSLKLIFGKRADSDYIRFDKDEAIIKAVFSNLNKEVKQYLKTLQIEDDKITIERWISKTNRNKITINNKNVTLTNIRELGLLIGDIHEQHDTQKLLDPQTAVDMIDGLGKNSELLNEYVILRHNYIDTKLKYEEALKKTAETNELLDDLKYRHDELTKANLEKYELTNLEQTILTLQNQKEIIESLNDAYLKLKEVDDKNLIYDSFKSTESISEYLTSFKDISKRLENTYYELEDIMGVLFSEIDSIQDYRLEELEELQSRKYFLEDLEYKYKMNVSELIDYIDVLEEEILKAENYDLFLDKLHKNKKNAYDKAFNKASILRKRRMETAKVLEKTFVDTLLRLAIDYVSFQVSFKESENDILKEDGIDEIEFLISLNEGEPLKPFYKVASGGELSRSMLALKILYGQIHDLSLMVFDEIDLGISGDAASKVANELLDLSKERQIITITHLPQVAAKATKHFNIEKQVISGRTNTVINDLDHENRVYHLAYMLSGKNLTEGAILHAKTLLKK